MLVKPLAATSADTAADAAIYFHASGQSLSGELQRLDQLTGGSISRSIAAGDFSGKRLELLSLPAPSGTKFRAAVVVGVGELASLDVGVAYRCAAAATRSLAAKSFASVAVFWQLTSVSEKITEAAVCGAQVGCQGQDLYRKEKNRYPFDTMLWHGDSPALCSGQILASGVNLARRLVNAPPDEIYPASFAEAAAVFNTNPADNYTAL